MPKNDSIFGELLIRSEVAAFFNSFQTRFSSYTSLEIELPATHYQESYRYQTQFLYVLRKLTVKHNSALRFPGEIYNRKMMGIAID